MAQLASSLDTWADYLRGNDSLGDQWAYHCRYPALSWFFMNFSPTLAVNMFLYALSRLELSVTTKTSLHHLYFIYPVLLRLPCHCMMVSRHVEPVCSWNLVEYNSVLISINTIDRFVQISPKFATTDLCYQGLTICA